MRPGGFGLESPGGGGRGREIYRKAGDDAYVSGATPRVIGVRVLPHPHHYSSSSSSSSPSSSGGAAALGFLVGYVVSSLDFRNCCCNPKLLALAIAIIGAVATVFFILASAPEAACLSCIISLIGLYNATEFHSYHSHHSYR